MRIEPPHADEVVLAGGTTNVGRVTRVGDTVRRPRRPTSEATEALLEHLEQVGFSGAPRYLGSDERGREVLSYIPGEAPIPPYPEWAFTDATLVSVAGLLRALSRCRLEFRPERLRLAASAPGALQTGACLTQRSEPRQHRFRGRVGRCVDRLRPGEPRLRRVGSRVRRPALGPAPRPARRAGRPRPLARAARTLRRRVRRGQRPARRPRRGDRGVPQVVLRGRRRRCRSGPSGLRPAVAERGSGTRGTNKPPAPSLASGDANGPRAWLIRSADYRGRLDGRRIARSIHAER